MPSNGMILIPIYRIFSTCYASAMAVSQRNFLFEICPPEERTSAIAIFTMTSGVITFLATLVATPLVNYVQANGVSVLGHEVYAQQLLAAVSVVIIIIVNLLWNLSYKTFKATKEYE